MAKENKGQDELPSIHIALGRHYRQLSNAYQQRGMPFEAAVFRDAAREFGRNEGKRRKARRILPTKDNTSNE